MNKIINNYKKIQLFLKDHKDLGIFMVGDLLSKAVQFLASIYLARTINSDNYGIILYALSIQAYIMLLSDFGLSIIGTREISKNIKNKNRIPIIVKNINFLKIIITLICIFIFIFILEFINISSIDKNIYYWTFFYALTQLINIEWYLIGLGDMKTVGLARFIVQLSILLGLVTYVKNTENYNKIPEIRLIFSLLAILIIIAYLMYFKKIKYNFTYFKKIKLLYVRKYLIESSPIAIISLIGLIYSTFDIIYLGFYVEKRDIAIYGVANIFFYFSITISSGISQYYFGKLSASISSREEFKKIFLRFFKIMIIAAVITCFPIASLAPIIMPIVFGDSYNLTGEILPWMMMAGAISFLNSIYGNGLISSGHQKKGLTATIAGAMMSIVLVLLLVPKYTMIGAIISRIVSEITTATLQRYYFNKLVFS